MIEKIKKIHDIAQRLLFSPKEKDAEHILDLYNFYTHFLVEEDNQGDISLKNGIALSIKNAADCIKDYKRTACFLRGIHKAIIECIKRFPNTELNILYAGCGPYAPLLLPLLSLFKPEDINVAEVHDSYPIGEILAIEDLGFFKKGEGGKAVEEGLTEQNGKVSINTSGGIKREETHLVQLASHRLLR